MNSILFVTGALSDGGAEKVLSVLASQMAIIGVETELVVLRDKIIVYPLAEEVKLYQLHEEGKKFVALRRIFALRKILRQSKANVVIPFLPIITLYTMIANIGVGKRIVASERGDPRANLFGSNFSSKDKIGNLFIRKWKLLGCADWVVFQTPDAQSYYGERIERKSSIIPNPLDTSRLPGRFEGEREKRIIAAGRFSEEKNFPMLLRTFAAFHKEFPEYKLELCGEGALRGELEAMCIQLGIVDAVEMPGFVSNLADRMHNAAMYISTSNHEGISNSMLEALGMGVPTIVTDCPVGGARMFIKNGENGIIIPMEDEDALLDGMQSIVCDRVFAENLSINAVKIREDLAAEKVCQQWLKIIHPYFK